MHYFSKIYTPISDSRAMSLYKEYVFVYNAKIISDSHSRLMTIFLILNL